MNRIYSCIIILDINPLHRLKRHTPLNILLLFVFLFFLSGCYSSVDGDTSNSDDLVEMKDYSESIDYEVYCLNTLPLGSGYRLSKETVKESPLILNTIISANIRCGSFSSAGEYNFVSDEDLLSHLGFYSFDSTNRVLHFSNKIISFIKALTFGDRSETYVYESTCIGLSDYFLNKTYSLDALTRFVSTKLSLF